MSLGEEDWAEFAGLFASGFDMDNNRTQHKDISRVFSADVVYSCSVAEQSTGLPAQAGKQRIHVAPPRPYDEWLQSCGADGSTHRPWRQQKGSHNRSESMTAPPMLGKLGKLVLPPVSTETTVTRSTVAAGVLAAKQVGQSWNFKSGARPTAVRNLPVNSSPLRMSYDKALDVRIVGIPELLTVLCLSYRFCSPCVC
eukprot:COSAG02_NODE_169_length_31557_cov_25.092473_23_plen_197_part_00